MRTRLLPRLTSLLFFSLFHGVIISGTANLVAATPTPTPTPPPTVCTLDQGFDDITTLTPNGWYMQNNSQPGPGITGWFQGNTATFPSQSGATDSYIAANYNNGTGAATLSNWLLTPPVTLQNGALFTFWTRTVDSPAYPDRLQVRLSTNGSSTNVGAGATSAGDFTTLLLDINPTYDLTDYPNAWTQFTVAISGLALPIKGRLAFRYFVENGGPAGANSDTVGIDSVTYECTGATPTPTPTPTASPTPGPTPTPVGCVVLYDQTDNSGPNVTDSQDFETFYDAFDDQAADDFVVPPGQTWTVQSVFLGGLYYNGPGPMPSVNLYFYNDAGGFPGSVVATYLNAPLQVDAAGSITITVPAGGLPLTFGTYWLSAQARMDFNPFGEWGWLDRTVQSNNAAVWQDPGGGFAVAACTSWGRRGATCGMDAVAPDQIFRLNGCVTLATPTPTPTASPSPTPTASPSPTSTPSASPSPTSTPTASPSPTSTPTASPSPTSTPTASPSPTSTPTASPSPTSTPTASPSPTSTPTASPSPTPSPTPVFISISGSATYCLNGDPVPGVSLNVTGDTVTSATTDSAGDYAISVPQGGNYLVTPAKPALAPTASGISTSDVLAIQRQFLGRITLTGCALTAADVNEDSSVTTVDTIATQRFFLGFTTGTSKVGQYRFTPMTRSYIVVGSDQTAQDYSTIILGDVVAQFVHRPEGPLPEGMKNSTTNGHQ